MRKLGLVSVLLLSSSAFASTWVWSGGESCLSTCNTKGMRPVVSGYYTPNGNPFYVCATNMGSEGMRPGYNLQPWGNTCTVGHGGEERGSNSFSCLCE